MCDRALDEEFDGTHLLVLGERVPDRLRVGDVEQRPDFVSSTHLLRRWVANPFRTEKMVRATLAAVAGSAVSGWLETLERVLAVPQLLACLRDGTMRIHLSLIHI